MATLPLEDEPPLSKNDSAPPAQNSAPIDSRPHSNAGAHRIVSQNVPRTLPLEQSDPAAQVAAHAVPSLQPVSPFAQQNRATPHTLPLTDDTAPPVWPRSVDMGTTTHSGAASQKVARPRPHSTTWRSSPRVLVPAATAGALLALAMVLAICSGGSEVDTSGNEEAATRTADPVGPTKNDEAATRTAAPVGPTTPKAPNREVTRLMNAFMLKLKGKSSHVERALRIYGARHLDTKDMDMYDLRSPRVVASKGDCRTMDANAGMTVRTYVLCWKGGKISTVEDKGMR